MAGDCRTETSWFHDGECHQTTTWGESEEGPFDKRGQVWKAGDPAAPRRPERRAVYLKAINPTPRKPWKLVMLDDLGGDGPKRWVLVSAQADPPETHASECYATGWGAMLGLARFLDNSNIDPADVEGLPE